MSALMMRDCGPATSLQDGGRYGYQRFGVSPAGAMDRLALAAANVLVGNGAETGAVEFMAQGGSLICEGGPLLVSLAGGGATLSVQGHPVAPFTSTLVREGDRLTVSPCRTGLFAYLAVAGGFDVAPELGSIALHRRSGMGGMVGRPLAAGDRLPCAAAGHVAPQVLIDGLTDGLSRADGPIRVVLGPQDDYFAPDTIARFLGECYRVSARIDRMGYQLEGPALIAARGHNIVSDGIVCGHVQVPGHGQPIVLMRDRQTTGGYPKIATVISADLDRLAQCVPGSEVTFRAIAHEEAVRLARQYRARIAALASRLKPAQPDLDSRRLLGLNLISGVVDARDPAVNP
ncbi:5-oxoprolinase subunit C family protein [Chelatococcus asaccharovorans]|uniref:5-oxoprolinase subunit C family protein n=1 Tax=Chelatococcus asaccharovorans TaxID=28210 RepID=UPI002B2746B9|nr:biotin-dependent carboxyltransferase family protein [Chelatococcus asaccharovorans]